MKFFLLCLYLFNILTFNLIRTISNDCILLDDFLKIENIECCGEIATCDDNGFITKLDLGDSKLINRPNFTLFPIFPKLVKIYLEAPENLNPSNVLPARFFDQPMLQVLTVYNSHINIIPLSYNTSSQIMEINIDHNDVVDYPTHFNALPNLQHLYLYDNMITGTVNLEGFKALNQFDVGYNQIVDMINIPKITTSAHFNGNPTLVKLPSEITTLTDLRELDIRSTGITELPPDLFKLKGLNYFKISENPQLKTKVINFGNRNIRNCTIDVTIECYQPGTCIKFR